MLDDWFYIQLLVKLQQAKNTQRVSNNLPKFYTIGLEQPPLLRHRHLSTLSVDNFVDSF